MDTIRPKADVFVEFEIAPYTITLSKRRTKPGCDNVQEPLGSEPHPTRIKGLPLFPGLL
ncbi:hypothetical protein [Bradyrhizobium zhanjiangense]|uniref:hypothetical protein n=1 Tax=Bradyrhizobium zhanjiangense TaxID=1325107 RepID=UPI0013E8B58C|nr:hypothetical protein [Bradyrhizobium zhanjiangense]